ncbi:MAG: acetylglutamate kinase [Acidobacteriota bacterium]|jgi:acetylglutamate kinase|nr:acetylglutamate kinase [Bryobacteraceae bacterium CoA2 C42]
MRVLVKLGGTLLDSEESRTAIAGQLTRAFAANREMVVVHGGGKQMTRFLAERNVESQFVEGLRVTTPEVLDAVLKVFAGTVNHLLVAALVRAGTMAVGLSGIDACLAEAEQLRPELGAVGRPVRSNPAVLETLTGGGFLPVVACVAGDRQGNIYNVNADQMAVACASGYGAAKLLFLTDVDGVKGADGAVIPRLTLAESRQLIVDGVATGGMQAKLNAAADALLGGVGEVVIAPGAATEVLARLLAGEAVGTRFVKE